MDVFFCEIVGSLEGPFLGGVLHMQEDLKIYAFRQREVAHTIQCDCVIDVQNVHDCILSYIHHSQTHHRHVAGHVGRVTTKQTS